MPIDRINTFTGDWLNGWSWNTFSGGACVWFSSEENINSWSSNRHIPCLKSCHSTGAIFPHVYEISPCGNIFSKVSVICLGVIRITLSSYYPWSKFVILWPPLTFLQQQNCLSTNFRYRNGAYKVGAWNAIFKKIIYRGSFPISCNCRKYLSKHSMFQWNLLLLKYWKWKLALCISPLIHITIWYFIVTHSTGDKNDIVKLKLLLVV